VITIPDGSDHDPDLSDHDHRNAHPRPRGWNLLGLVAGKLFFFGWALGIPPRCSPRVGRAAVLQRKRVLPSACC
jgi:hypothetical protein